MTASGVCPAKEKNSGSEVVALGFHRNTGLQREQLYAGGYRQCFGADL